MALNECCYGTVQTQWSPDYPGWLGNIFPQKTETLDNPQKLKHTKVTKTQIYLQTVAKLMIPAITVLRNYCNNVNEQNYTRF
jgi:hypothetical protein